MAKGIGGWHVAVLIVLIAFSGCAKTKFDLALEECDRISDSGERFDLLRSECKSAVISSSLEFDRCYEAGEKELECQVRIASKTDPTLCDISSCPERCYFEVAKARGDAALCGGIDDIGNRDTCYLELVSETGDSQFCGMITSQYEIMNSGCFGGGRRTMEGNMTFQEACIVSGQENPEDCGSFGDENLRRSCLVYVALRKGDCGIASFGPEELAMENACHLYVATRRLDWRECDKVVGVEKFKCGCYAVVAASTGNESLCEFDEDFTERCRTMAYAAKGDMDLCDTLRDEDLAHECRARVLANAGGD